MPGQLTCSGLLRSHFCKLRACTQTDEQQALILQLQHVTNLTYPFAHMALAQNNWDAQTTFTNFPALHASGTIPPEAFRPGQVAVGAGAGAGVPSA